MLLGKRLVLGARYGCFGLFIALNAVICTVGVYNLSLAKDAGLSVGVDGYLIFLGALALLCVIPIIFIDIYFKDAYISRVWVECCWIAFFWIAELVAAATFTATVPSILCDSGASINGTAACQSSQALEACTWLCMVALFVYLAVLVLSAAAHERRAPNVWETSVRQFPWYSDEPHVEFPDPAPPYRQRPSMDPVIAAPQPRHLISRIRIPVPASVRHSIGRLSARAPSVQERNMAVPLPTNPTPPPPQSRRSRLGFSRRSSNRPSSRRPYDPEAFYPEHLQAALQAIVYDLPEDRRASAAAGPSRRPSRPLPAILSSRPRQPPAPPVPPVPTLSRPLPTPAPARRPPPSRPQLTIDTSGRRRSRPLPQLRIVGAPAPAPAPVAGPSTRRFPAYANPTPTATPTSASISPLGEWPRANVLSLPLRPRKKPPPPPSSFPAAVAEEPPSRRTSDSSDDLALSSSAGGHTGDHTGGAPLSVSPRGSLTARPNHRPTGPRSRQASLTSINSIQLSNLITQSHGQQGGY